MTGTVCGIVNFLVDLIDLGYQYRSLNALPYHWYMITVLIDSRDAGQLPMVARVLKGVLHEQPPQPRYTQTSDVGVVAAYSCSKV